MDTIEILLSIVIFISWFFASLFYFEFPAECIILYVIGGLCMFTLLIRLNIRKEQPLSEEK